MIYKKSIIQVMDLTTHNVSTGTVDSIFGKLMVNSKKSGDTISLTPPIMPSTEAPSRLKVTDMFGWSDVTKFIRIGVDLCADCSDNILTPIIIETSRGKTITCFRETLFPVYNPKNTKRGFHGETKYEHEIKCAEDIIIGDTLRVIHCKDQDDNDIYFDTVRSIQYDGTETMFYTIETKSKYMTCNDIYIYTGGLK